jgi:tripartite-type tricarboxylate transporter receptor subunit TctC
MMKKVITTFAATMLCAAPAFAQESAATFPSKPLHAITALSAGGTSDVFMRVVGEQFQKKTGQPIVVDNRPGGAFNIAGQACGDSAPDGYTICLLPVETLSYNQFMFKKLAYDPKSFEPISNAFFVTAVLVVNSSLNVKNLPELAAASKAKPKTLSYMSPAVPLAYFMETWKKESEADIVKVPYRGGADAANAILGGSTPVAFSGLANFIPHIRSGAMNALAVDTDARSPLLPDVPTLRELNYKGPLTPAYFGFVAPKGTPKPLIDKLRAIFVEIASDKAFQERNMINLGLIPILDTPEQFAAYLKGNWVLAEKIVKDSGLEPQ